MNGSFFKSIYILKGWISVLLIEDDEVIVVAVVVFLVIVAVFFVVDDIIVVLSGIVSKEKSLMISNTLSWGHQK